MDGRTHIAYPRAPVRDSITRKPVMTVQMYTKPLLTVQMYTNVHNTILTVQMCKIQF